MAQLAPYTKLFLQQLLDSLFGDGNWNLVVDHLIYTVYIDVETDIQNLYDQFLGLIREIIPSNLVLFTKRLQQQEIETASVSAISFVVKRLALYSNPVPTSQRQFWLSINAVGDLILYGECPFSFRFEEATGYLYVSQVDNISIRYDDTTGNLYYTTL